MSACRPPHTATAPAGNTAATAAASPAVLSLSVSQVVFGDGCDPVRPFPHGVVYLLLVGTAVWLAVIAAWLSRGSAGRSADAPESHRTSTERVDKIIEAPIGASRTKGEATRGQPSC